VLSRRDRDWQVATVVASLIAMIVFEMFHSPPCDLSFDSCSGAEFAAKIGVNLIWGVVMGGSTGIALAAVMGLVVDALDARRTMRTIGPLLRVLLGIVLTVGIFFAVLVRFEIVWQ